MISFYQMLIAVAFLHLVIQCARTNSAELGPNGLLSFSISNSDGGKVFVENVTISFQLNEDDISVYKYPRTEAVNFFLGCNISFEADVLRLSNHWVPLGVPSKKSDSFSAVLLGKAKLFKLTDKYYSLVECESLLLQNKNSENTLKTIVRDEIVSLINIVMASQICQKIKEIAFNELKDQRIHPYDFGSMSITKDLEDQGKINPMLRMNLSHFIFNNIASKQSPAPQTGLRVQFNGFVDFLISRVVEIFRKTNNGKIKVPDIHVRFSDGPYYTPRGDIYATQGTFSDVTTLRRTSNVQVVNTGRKWTVSCGFGLSVANLDYPYYEFIYGYPLASGSLRVSIQGVAFDVTIIIDCNRRPGKVTLRELRLPTLGDINVAVTGLYFNNILSYLISYLGNIWKYQISALVLEEIKSVIQHEIDQLSCGLSHG